MILFRRACPGGAGPDARLHYAFDSTSYERIEVGQVVAVSGEITRRYEKREREYIEMRIEMRAASDGRLLVRYDDTCLLRYKPGGKA